MKLTKPRKRTALQPIAMQVKTHPLQDRSRQTYEAILLAAATLLEEVGIERFSTNLVCRRAKLTPPALYRYFPNKYALLNALGTRLMDAQDEAVYAWIDAGGLEAATPEAAHLRNLEIQQRVLDITRKQPGALWVLRALRAVPAMREVRIASRTRVADRLYHGMKHHYPNTAEPSLRRAVRLNLELAMAVMEMTLEEPSDEPEEVGAEFSRLIVDYFARFT